MSDNHTQAGHVPLKERLAAIHANADFHGAREMLTSLNRGSLANVAAQDAHHGVNTNIKAPTSLLGVRG